MASIVVIICDLFSIDYVNIYIFSIFSSIDFAQWKSVGPPHIAFIVIDLLQLNKNLIAMTKNVNKRDTKSVQMVVFTLFRKKNRTRKNLKKVAIKCRDKSENKLSLEEKVGKVSRFLSVFCFHNFSFL